MERRFVKGMLVRAAEPTVDGAGKTLTGYAALFNQVANMYDYFDEIIAPGAFAKSLAGDVRALWNHNSDFPLGRTTNQTLQLSEDARGLAFTLTPPDTAMGRDALVSVDRGDVTGVSFGFEVVTDEWATVGGKKTRTLREVMLYEISPVVFPAYEDTSVEARSLESLAQDAERRLAAAGSAIARSHLERRTRLAEIG